MRFNKFQQINSYLFSDSSSSSSPVNSSAPSNVHLCSSAPPSGRPLDPPVVVVPRPPSPQQPGFNQMYPTFHLPSNVPTSPQLDPAATRELDLVTKQQPGNHLVAKQQPLPQQPSNASTGAFSQFETQQQICLLLACFQNMSVFNYPNSTLDYFFIPWRIIINFI